MKLVVSLKPSVIVTNGYERHPRRTPLDDVMDDIRRELVLRVAKADRDEHRDIYHALEHE